jgi:hypothetical protein
VAGRPRVVPQPPHPRQRQLGGIGRRTDLRHRGRGPRCLDECAGQLVARGPGRLQRRAPVEAADPGLGLAPPRGSARGRCSFPGRWLPGATACTPRSASTRP